MLKSNNIKKGFTIIEVIIVLVIAAIIMLAVFLVVPQLQRNSRNARQQDNARRTLTAVQQFVTNNQGSFPTGGQNILDITGTMKNPSTNSDLVAADIAVGTVGTAPSLTTAGKIFIYNAGKCSGSTNTATATNAYAVIIATEPSGSGFCVDIQ